VRKIVVLVKQVPHPEAIEFDQETKTLKREGVPLILNPFDRGAVRLAVDRVGRERFQRRDLLVAERIAAGRDGLGDDRVVGRVAGPCRPALAVAADPRRRRQRPQQRQRVLGRRPEQREVAAEDPALRPAGPRVGDHRLQRGQVSVDVVEDGDHRPRV